MTALTLTIPDSALSTLRRSPVEFAREMKLAAAIHWYQRGLMSQERAAELAGLNRRDFIHALAREGVDVFVLDNDSLARELGMEEVPGIPFLRHSSGIPPAFPRHSPGIPHPALLNEAGFTTRREYSFSYLSSYDRSSKGV